MRTTSM